MGVAEDDLLIERGRCGDRQALVELYDRYKSRVFAYCLAIVGSREDAEDAAHDAFRYVFAKLAAYRARGRFAPYLFRVARSFCMDLLRRRTRHTSLPEEFDVAEPPDERFESDEREGLRSALEALPPPYREVVFLRVTNGLSVQEVSRIVGVPEGTVKSRLHHAIRALRRMMGMKVHELR